MGGGNVALAFANWSSRLPRTSLLALVYMANVSKDSDERPRYWAGRDPIATFALGREVPPDPAHKAKCGCLVCSERRAIYEAVRVLMKTLVDAGAATRVSPGRPTSNAVFELHVAQGNPGQQPRFSLGSPQENPGLAQGGSGPEERARRDKEIGEENGAPQVTNSPAPVDHQRKDDQLSPVPKPQPGLCPHGNPDVWLDSKKTNHACRECRHAGR